MRRRLAVVFAALALVSCEDEFPDDAVSGNVEGEWTIVGPTNATSARTAGCSGSMEDAADTAFDDVVGTCVIEPVTVSQSGGSFSFEGSPRFSCFLPGGEEVAGDVSGSGRVTGNRLEGSIRLVADDASGFRQGFDFEGTVDGTSFPIFEIERVELRTDDATDGSCGWSPEPRYQLSIDR